MTQYEQAAIIGYWRSGATWHQISLIMNITPFEAEKIVYDYQLKLKKKL